MCYIKLSLFQICCKAFPKGMNQTLDMSKVKYDEYVSWSPECWRDRESPVYIMAVATCHLCDHIRA